MARLKSSADLVRAVETAGRFYEEPPTRPLTVAVEWSDLRLSADDWAEACGTISYEIVTRMGGGMTRMTRNRHLRMR